MRIYCLIEKYVLIEKVEYCLIEKLVVVILFLSKFIMYKTDTFVPPSSPYGLYS